MHSARNESSPSLAYGELAVVPLAPTPNIYISIQNSTICCTGGGLDLLFIIWGSLRPILGAKSREPSHYFSFVESV